MSIVDGELVDLIGAIYDAALDPALWHEALDRIRRHFGLYNALMSIAGFGQQPTSVAVSVNIPENYLAMAASSEHAPDVVRLWGGVEQLARYPIEEPIVLLQVADQRSFATNKYYRDFALPQGLVDLTAIVLTRDRRQLGNIAFGRHRDFGPLSEDVIAGLRVLAPHLRRAALITGILDEERRKNAMFEAVLKAVRSGVVLVDRSTRIIYRNPAADAVIDAGGPLHDDHGKLELRGEVVPGHLQKAIEAAADGDIPLGRRGIAIPGTRTDGTPFVVHVMPLGDRSVRTGMPGEAVAGVFIAERGDDPDLVVDAATMIYNLTPTEARVFELIVDGRPSGQIAKLLAIAPSTLKWHTLRLFDKTGQHRRADLVRLAAQLRPGG